MFGGSPTFSIHDPATPCLIARAMKRAWPYDAAYVALAEFLDAELVTADGKFEKIPGLRCRVRNLRAAS